LDKVNFDINVTNTGKVALDTVTVVDALPEGLVYLNSSPKGIKDGKNLSWPLGALEPAKSHQISLIAQADQNASGNQINRVNATGQLPDGSNVTANDTEPVEVIGSAISVEKSVVPPYGSPLEKITFGIKVTNIGKMKLDPVIIEDVLPAGLNYIDSIPAGIKHGQNISWLLGTLEPGQSDYIMLLTQIDWSASGTLQNWVSATGVTLNGTNVTDVDDELVKVVSCAINIIIPPNRGLECCCNNCCDNCCNCPGNITNNIKLNNSGHSIQVITFGNANVSNLSQESKSQVE